MPNTRGLLVALSLVFSSAIAQDRPRALSVDRIVAVVNNEVITQYELQGRVKQVLAQLRRQKTEPPGEEVLERQVLERLVYDKVQLQLARETGLQVDEAQLEQGIGRIAAGNNMTVAQFRAALTSDGTSWETFREDIRNEMVIGRLRDREVENRIVVSEGEIDNYLANPEAAGAPLEEIHLAHILLRVPEQADASSIQAIKQRADSALAQLRGGSAFAQVAAAFSDAPDGLKGGDIGWRAPDRLPGLFADAVRNLRPGEVSEVLRSPAGFHIIKLVEKRGGAVATEKVRQTHARHILIKLSELVTEAEVRRKLVDLKERLANGADFAELARLYSNDLSASRGGDLGWIYPGDTVPPFERAMDALKPGEISEPIESPFGWHLIQVIERRVEDTSKERQRLLARAALRERKSDEAYQDWLRQMRDRAYVEYKLEDK